MYYMRYNCVSRNNTMIHEAIYAAACSLVSGLLFAYNMCYMPQKYTDR